MSKSWQTILVKKGKNSIWNPLKDYLKRDFTVFEHLTSNLQDFGTFLEKSPEIRMQSFKIIVIHEYEEYWAQVLTDQIFFEEGVDYRDLPDYMYSNGVLSFISEFKLDAFWYGFVDRYYWWYEIIESGQVISKWNSNLKQSRDIKPVSFLEEILDFKGGNPLKEIPLETFPEGSIEIINNLVKLPILIDFLPMRYVTLALDSIRPDYELTASEKFLSRNFGRETKILLYK